MSCEEESHPYGRDAEFTTENTEKKAMRDTKNHNGQVAAGAEGFTTREKALPQRRRVRREKLGEDAQPMRAMTTVMSSACSGVPDHCSVAAIKFSARRWGEVSRWRRISSRRRCMPNSSP